MWYLACLAPVLICGVLLDAFSFVRVNLTGFLDLLHLVVFHGSPTQVRRVGMTRFADPREYPDVKLSEQNRIEYFRDGITVVRGALKPHLVRALREALAADFGERNSVWSHYRAADSDELLDFYLYSTLGALAAELFRHPGTETASEEPVVHLWRDFMYFRHPWQPLTAMHLDLEDCDFKGLPPNHTRGNRPRIWTTLDEGIHGPIFFNQSQVLASISDKDVLHRYWRGELLEAVTDHVSDDGIRDLMLGGGLVQPLDLRLGDVILHAPCLLHSSPEPHHPTVAGVLFPTYAISSSLVRYKLWATRSCDSAVGGGGTVGEDPSCFPVAYPPEARPARGTTIRWKHRGTTLQWFTCALQMTGKNGITPVKCM